MNNILVNVKNTWYGDYFEKDLVSIEEIMQALQDEVVDARRMEEDLDETLRKLETMENNNATDPYEEYGISERDFI